MLTATLATSTRLSKVRAKWENTPKKHRQSGERCHSTAGQHLTKWENMKKSMPTGTKFGRTVEIVQLESPSSYCFRVKIASGKKHYLSRMHYLPSEWWPLKKKAKVREFRRFVAAAHRQISAMEAEQRSQKYPT